MVSFLRDATCQRLRPDLRSRGTHWSPLRLRTEPVQPRRVVGLRRM